MISYPADQGDTPCLLVAKPPAGSKPKQATRILFRALHVLHRPEREQRSRQEWVSPVYTDLLFV